MQKLLILGGPSFIGRNLLLALEKQANYDITLFNRGETNTELFPSLKRINGDRNSTDIQQISTENWDYIIDLSCYYPSSIEQVLAAINKEKLTRYIFISTCSVYDNEAGKTDEPTLENGSLLSCSKEEEGSLLPAAYGNKKVACENLLSASGIDFISLRPALVYGAYDYTDRLYYWLYQVYQNNPILVPDHGERVISLTYVQDLVNATLQALTIEKHSSIYNVISQEKVSIHKIIATCAAQLNKKPTYANASPSFLMAQNIQQWADMPLWIDGDYFTYSNKKLLEDFNLKLVDWTQSIEETIAYYKNLGWKEPIYGITKAKQLALLEALQTY